MRFLNGLLAALLLASCSPAYAQPTAGQAAQIKTIRDALSVLEGLQNPPPVVVAPPPVVVTPPPVVVPPPAPAPIVAQTCALTVSVDLENAGNALATFQNAALGGKKVDCVWFNFAADSWAVQMGNINGALAGNALLKAARAQGSNVYWTLPILVSGTNWASAASGAYDTNWRQAFQALAAYVPAGSPIYLRPAAEFSGNWFPWAVAPGQEANFVKAWQRYVGIARSVSPNMKFEWSPAMLFGNTCATADPKVVNLTAAYPGDAYVDIFGLDPYYRTLGANGLTPDQGWGAMMNAWGPCQPNLTWGAALAKAHGKILMLTEVGVDTDVESGNLAKLAAWIKQVGAWQSYFNRTATGDILARIDDGTKPNSLAAYRAAFGQ